MAVEIKITQPPDRTIQGYDLQALQDAITKHRDNIKMFEDQIERERAQMEATSQIINRKRELDARRPRPNGG